MQNTFLKTHAAAKDYTLQDLDDPQKRKDLVGQMSTSTGRLPGSVGERRKMRQQLEGMVNQIEAETADQKENGGQGRIPGGFCTLTCPVYKWEQLFDMVLKSYPSGSSDDPNAMEFYCKWKALPIGQERNMAMRQAFYHLSVANPACVQWYCAVKLEMAMHLLVDVITRQLQSSDVPGLEQSITEVKSLLETMHLNFGVPRVLSSRSFTDMWLRSDMRKIKSPAQICQASSSSEKLALNSEVQRYWQRTEWTLPSEEHLLQKHPLTGLPLWRAILHCTMDNIPSDEQLKDRRNEVADAWPKFLERLSWWQLKGIFRRDHGSLKYKQRADIVIVHPEARFTKALTPERWREACTYGLMAYCNHGPCCAQSTFSNLACLEAMSSDELEALMDSFVFMSDNDRKTKNMSACPPHLRRNYELGQARRRRAEGRKLSRPQVNAALPQVKYVCTEHGAESWRQKRSGEMDNSELHRARLLWKSANEDEAEDAKTQDTLDQRAELDVSMIHRRMHALLRSWKVGSRELHNATLAAGLEVPEHPSSLK